jgi:hypothetical protein
MLRECASEGEGVNERKVQPPSCMEDHDQVRTTGDLQRPIKLKELLPFPSQFSGVLSPHAKSQREYPRTIINDPATSVTSKYSK